MNFGKKLLGLSLLSLALVSPLQATTDDVQVLVEELQVLTEKSRQERAADRWLQNALEDLVARYSFPWKDSLLKDDFADGDYLHGVTWNVGAGDFWVDRRLGLRSRVEANQAVESRQEKPRQGKEDLGRALLGALLQETLGPEKSSSETSATTSSVNTPASIRTEVAIPTTFAVESIFSQNNRPGEKGQFEWTVMQDASANNAYKLIITTGNRASVDLVRIRSGRESYLDSVELPILNEGGEHSLSWRQKSDGGIHVFIDGEQKIAITDRAFRYGFKYIGMVNRSGDFSIREVEILGGRK